MKSLWALLGHEVQREIAHPIKLAGDLENKMVEGRKLIGDHVEKLQKVSDFQRSSRTFLNQRSLNPVGATAN